MALTVRRTGDTDYGAYVKALICGDPGAGKTLISSTFPKPYFASAEGGLMSVADRNIPHSVITEVQDLLDLKRIIEQPSGVRAKMLGDLAGTGPIEVETFVVDTIDEIQKMLVRERLVETKQDTMKVQDWGWMGEQLRTIVRGLRNLDMHVVLTCHVATKEEGDSGVVTVKPAIQGAMGDEIAGYVDLSLLLRSRTEVRVVGDESKRVSVRYLQTMPEVKYPWIKDRSGKLPAEIAVNFHDDFERMSKLIYAGRKTPTEKKAEVAAVTEQAIAEVSGPGLVAVDEVEALSPAVAAGSQWGQCKACGKGIETEDQRSISEIRAHKPLCVECFKAHKSRKAS